MLRRGPRFVLDLVSFHVWPRGLPNRQCLLHPTLFEMSCLRSSAATTAAPRMFTCAHPRPLRVPREAGRTTPRGCPIAMTSAERQYRRGHRASSACRSCISHQVPWNPTRRALPILPASSSSTLGLRHQGSSHVLLKRGRRRKPRRCIGRGAVRARRSNGPCAKSRGDRPEVRRGQGRALRAASRRQRCVSCSPPLMGARRWGSLPRRHARSTMFRRASGTRPGESLGAARDRRGAFVVASVLLRC